MINVAVVGCGYWGPNLIRNFSQIELANLYCICDIDKSKMAPILKTYPTVRMTTNYKDILDAPDVDAIAIALPVAMHFSVAKEALLANKHVLIEKPMTSTVEEAEELITIAQRKKRVLMVDHTFEYSEAVNWVKGVIQSGELGDIYYIRAEWLNLGLLQPDVNVVWDLVTHVASIISYVTGLEPHSVNAHAAAYIRKGIPEVANLHIKYPQDITAYVTVSWLEPRKTRRVTVVGAQQLLIYDLTNTEEPVKVYNKGVETTNGVGQMRINYRYGDMYAPNINNIEPLRSMCRHFPESIIKKKTPRSDGRSGLNVVRILEAAEMSLTNNGEEVNLR